MSNAYGLNRQSSQGISDEDPAQKLAETRGVFEERRGCARRERRTSDIGKKESSLADTIFVIFLAKDAFASCARRAAVVEKREKRGKSMKSIRSHERSKQRRDEKETRRRKFSKAGKRAKGRNARAR